jgi:hypothetical protein
MNIRPVLISALLCLFAITSLDCSFKRYDKSEVSEYKINVNGKTKVSLENKSGDIKVYKGDSSTGLVVKAEKITKVKKRDLNEPFTEAYVDIDTSSEIVRIRGEIEKERGFIRFNINEKTEINYTITLPPGIKFSVDNTNGSASFNNISNDLDINIINGHVDVDNISGLNKFDITNGKMKGSLDSTKGLTIDIINGGVDFKLDSNFSAIFNVETVNGKVTEENLNFTTLTSERKSLKGRIGNSNAVVKIDIVNGKVVLKSK